MVEVGLSLPGISGTEAVIEGRSFRGVEDIDWSLDGVATKLEIAGVSDDKMLMVELPSLMPSALMMKSAKATSRLQAWRRGEVKVA